MSWDDGASGGALDGSHLARRAIEMALTPAQTAQGWEEHLDQRTGRMYWWNRTTKLSRWTPPTPPPPAVVATKLPESECRRLGLQFLPAVGSNPLPQLLPAIVPVRVQQAQQAQPVVLQAPAAAAAAAAAEAAAAAAKQIRCRSEFAAAAAAGASAARTAISSGSAFKAVTSAPAPAPAPASGASGGAAASTAAQTTIELLSESEDEQPAASGDNTRSTTAAAAADAAAAAADAAATAANATAHRQAVATSAPQWPAGGFTVGLQCDAQDTTGMWAKAQIVKVGAGVRRGRVRVTYKGYSRKWDEWISLSGSPLRLAAPGLHTGKGKLLTTKSTSSASASESDDEQSEGESSDDGGPARGSSGFAMAASAARTALVGRRIRRLDSKDDAPLSGTVEKHNEDDKTFNLRFEDGSGQKRVTEVALQKMLQPLTESEAHQAEAEAAARAQKLKQQTQQRRAQRQQRQQRRQQQLDDLLEAVEAGDEAELQSALDAGASVNASKEDGITAVMLAAQNKQTAALQVLLGRKGKKAADVDLVRAPSPLSSCSSSKLCRGMCVLAP